MQPLPGIIDVPSAAALPPLLNPLALMYNAAESSVMTATSSSDAGKSFLIIDGKTPTPAPLSTTPPPVVDEAVPTMLGWPGAPPLKLMRVPSPAASLSRGGGGSMSDGESCKSGLVTPTSLACAKTHTDQEMAQINKGLMALSSPNTDHFEKVDFKFQGTQSACLMYHDSESTRGMWQPRVPQ